MFVKRSEEPMKEFVRKNPARVAAFVSSAIALLLTAVNSDMPVEATVVFVMSVLGLGEYTQRVENHKTECALLETSPIDIEGDDLED
jgi:phosphate/sulfate permease